MQVDSHHKRHLQDAESSTRELGSRLRFQATRTRGVTGVSSCVRTCQWLTSNSGMGDAELAAHANDCIPSAPVNQDMDAQLRYLFVTPTSGPALQIIRPSGVQAFRYLARRYNPRSRARSLADAFLLWARASWCHKLTDCV